MVSVETLKEQFDDLGVDASEEVIDNCLQMCLNYNLDDPAEFVEKWIAFSISNLNGEEPTLQSINEFENKEFKNQIGNLKKRKTNFSGDSKLHVYKQESDDEDNEMLGNYVCITPKNDKKAASKLQHRTPDVTKSTTFTPVSYSPLTTAKRSRIESSKSGNVIYSFGNFAASSTEPRINQTLAIKLAELNDETKWISDKTKYMMALEKDDGHLAADRIFTIGQEISKKILEDENRAGEELVLSHCDVTSHEPVRCLGKIFCSGQADQLNQKSCLFIGFDENKLRTVQLDFSKLPSVQIFPGEICIVGGNNPRGKTFYVTELFSERILEKCPLPSPRELTGPLHMMIASAPFTSDDNILFEYLDKLMLSCKENSPDVLILSGSFLPIKSQLILDIAMGLDEHFNKMLSDISESVGEKTKVIIVSSCEDINSSACYPTQPYKLKKLRPFTNIFMASDPSIIEVNGIKIGITSTDIVKQLADAEFCVNAGADKIRRYVNYIFHQKSFYPLFPPKEPTDMLLLHEYAMINKIPNILVVPSDINCYMRDINGCLCINPGRLMSNNTGGTFARIIVQPPKEAEKPTSSWISGQILHI